jgi:hypothetical protein
MFALNGDRYDAVELRNSEFWIPRLQLGLGLWQGTYQGIHRLWSRWYYANGDWVQTPVEQGQQQVDQEYQRAEQERQRADQEQQRVERLIAKLKSLGIEPDLELSPAQWFCDLEDLGKGRSLSELILTELDNHS